MAFNVIPLYRNIVFKLPHIFGSLIPQGTLSFASQVYVSVPSFLIYISLPLLGSIPLDFTAKIVFIDCPSSYMKLGFPPSSELI